MLIVIMIDIMEAMLDNYGRKINYLRVSVTELCNLRCKYCMPQEGIVKRSHEEMMTAEETISAVRAAALLGVDKVRVTGGEPLVKRGILRLCREIGEIEGIRELCITTNGTLLPEFAQGLRDAGVSRVNISIDTMNPDKYRSITRIGELDQVLRGIDAAFEAGFEKVKLNTVIMKGFNDDEIGDFVELTRDKPIDVRFIELMPIGEGAGLARDSFISFDDICQSIDGLESMGQTDGVAEMYRLPGAAGRVGFIRTISCGFCDRCNKIRITADGMLKPCLHSEKEFSLKGRTPLEMEEILKEAILRKPEKRDALDVDNPSKAGRNMNRIGG